ncbi:glycosyltransferase family 4 protein [Haloferax denitrificans]|uniref:glycosyltransferase family 4 protein n=1 Tax=Haloferax denitrificans TaxID=35745 RepID=UPI003C6FA4AE
MHVVAISNLFPPEVIGGAEKNVATDMAELAERGHKVSVLTTGVESPTRSFSKTNTDGMSIYRTYPMNMYSPYEHQEEAAWKKPIQHIIDQWNPYSYHLFYEKIEELNPDIIHIHNYSGLSKSVFSAAGMHNAPVVHTLHDYSALHIRPNLFVDGEIIQPGKIMQVYQKYNDEIIGGNVDLILSPTQFVINKHNEEGVFLDTPTKCIPHGIKNRGLNDYGNSSTNNSKSRILYVGQLTQSKGVDLIIDAMKMVDVQNIECHILGKGPERDTLEEKSKEDDRIIFHGFVSEAELNRQYHLADYTIVPSRWLEVFGLVIYESFAQRTPVIAADIGGIPELIQEDKTGYLFEPKNPEDLAQVIHNSLTESDRLAKNVAKKDIGLQSHIDLLTKTYQILLDTSNKNTMLEKEY